MGRQCVCTGLLPACLWGPGGLSPACGPGPLGCRDNVKGPSSIWATSLALLSLVLQSRSSDLLISV